MATLMEEAVERLRRLPEARQEELAPFLMMLAEDDSPYRLTAEDVQIIEESEAEAGQGELMTDEQMRKLWAQFGV